MKFKIYTYITKWYWYCNIVKR